MTDLLEGTTSKPGTQAKASAMMKFRGKTVAKAFSTFSPGFGLSSEEGLNPALSEDPNVREFRYVFESRMMRTSARDAACS